MDFKTSPIGSFFRPIIPHANPVSGTSKIATIGQTGIRFLGACNLGVVRGIHIGAGRFARAHWLNLLARLLQVNAIDDLVIIVQPNKTDVARKIVNDEGIYQVVFKSSKGQTEEAHNTNIAGAMSLNGNVGLIENVKAVDAFANCAGLNELQWMSVGITEQGVNPDSVIMSRLAYFFVEMYMRRQAAGRLKDNFFLFSTDNLDNNAETVKEAVLSKLKDDPSVSNWFQNRVKALNTVLDTIVTSTEDPLIPCAEPYPETTLVVLDEEGICPIPFEMLNKVLQCEGKFIVTKSRKEFDKYTAWKLLAENGIHRHMFAVSALSGFRFTRYGINNDPIASYLARIGYELIAPTLEEKYPIEGKNADKYVLQWMLRLDNPNIDHDNFWVGQNFFKKYVKQIVPLIELNDGNLGVYEDDIAKSIAFGLRFNTPVTISTPGFDLIYTGKLDKDVNYNNEKWVYLKGDPSVGKKDLEVDGVRGLYDFRCETNLASKLMDLWDQPRHVIKSALIGDLGILKNIHGFDLTQYPSLAEKVVDYYYQMVGEGKTTMEVLVQ